MAPLGAVEVDMPSPVPSPIEKEPINGDPINVEPSHAFKMRNPPDSSPGPNKAWVIEKAEAPAWIADKLAVPVDRVACMEVPSNSSIVYSALVRYLQIVAVDAGGPPPKPVDAVKDDPGSPGVLSSVGTVAGSGVAPLLGSNDPFVAECAIGLGFMRAKVDGKDVFVSHVARERPIAECGRAVLFRCVTLFATEPATVKKMLQKALDWLHERDLNKRTARAGMYVLYTLDVDQCGSVSWRNHGHKNARPLDSVFLKKGQREAIVQDFRSFSKPDTKKWYLRHGLPHRRSYLFYGPPGVGKTSLIRGLAGELKLTTCFLNLADKNMGNRQLQDALMKIPKPSMIVLEDVDVLFNEDRKSTSQAPLTFSGILNALDGLISADGILTVMTTNHIDRLDPALIRAGRVDRRFSFETPDKNQLAKLFQSYYEDAGEEMAKKFANVVFDREEPSARSIATLQQLFVHCREKSATECMDSIPEFFSDFYPNDRRDPKRNLYV